MFYNTKGQLVRSVDPDLVTTLMSHNSLGEQTTTATDLFRAISYNDEIDNITYGIDTVQFSEIVPALRGSLPVWRTTTKVWFTDPAAPTIVIEKTVAQNDRTANGLQTWSWQIGRGATPVDPNATFTTTLTTLNGSGNWTQQTTHPDGTSTRTTYATGLMDQSETFDANNNLIASTAMRNASNTPLSGYDSLKRPTHQRHSRTGVTTTEYRSLTADVVFKITDPGNRTTEFTHDLRGRQIAVNAPDTQDASGNVLANITNTSYYSYGQTKAQWGDQTNPTFHEYDYAHRIEKLHTYQTAPSLSQSTTSPPADSAVTTWKYSPQRGWLETKTDALNRATAYDYTDAGRLFTRTSARGILTTYGYDDGGRRTTTNYSNEPAAYTTPNVVMEYDALSRMTKLFQGGNLHAEYRYDPANLTLVNEDQQIDSLNQTLTRTRDGLRRPTGYTHSAGNAIWSYDNAGRLQSVTDGTDTFTYGYQYDLIPGSGSATEKHQGDPNGANPSFLPFTLTGPQITTTLAYETTRRALLTRTNATTVGTVSAFAYTINPLGQRIALATSRSAFNQAPAWAWQYNSRGELVQANDTSAANHDRAYEYDTIGNRKKTVNGLLADLPISDTYTANPINQYTAIGPFSPTHDLDGNLIDAQIYPNNTATHANATYTWDAENRLVKCVTASTTVLYEYDPYSRLIARTEASTTTRYLYDGWNRIAEYQQSGTTYTLLKKYLWGMDLSGTMQRAGGVGGLLSMSLNSQPSTLNFYPTYDGNGNISEYANQTGATAAHFEYDPFGNLTEDSNNNASQFPYRFSTKPQDSLTGLYYYGYRWYDSVTGRWPSRDPIGEKGGVILYGMVGNDVMNRFDLIGLRLPDEDLLELNKIAPGQFNMNGNPLPPTPPLAPTTTKVNDEIYEKNKWHHTKATVALEYCRCTEEEAKSIADKALATFSEFNKGNLSADVGVYGNLAGFNLHGFAGLLSDFINSDRAWVTLDGGGIDYAQQARTHEYHPVAGYRRWGSYHYGSQTSEYKTLHIWTEAYEMANNLNVLAADIKGWPEAIKMWDSYLRNVAQKVVDHCGGQVFNRVSLLDGYNPVIRLEEETDGQHNSFKK